MIFHDVEQNTDEWLALRVGKATSSNFGTIMANHPNAFGEPAKKYALQLAIERITGEREEGGFSNSHMDRGHEQEPIARALYEEEKFVTVSNGGFFDCGEYGDSPDGLVMVDGVLEIKSVIASTHYATMKRGSFDPAYRWQMVGHLDCSGRQWADFASYCAAFPEEKQLLVFRTYRGEFAEEFAMLAERRAKFLQLVDQIFNEIRG